MLEKFLREIVALVAGASSEKIVETLYKKQNVNEFLIAKKLKLTINQARNILYKLAQDGLVYFNRKKDAKSGGWYTYFWTLDEQKCLFYYRDRLMKEVELLEQSLLVNQTRRFYVCGSCGMEVTEENALLQNFTCPECGEVFLLKDSQESIAQSSKDLQKLREKLTNLHLLIEEIVAMREKVRAKKEVADKATKKEALATAKKKRDLENPKKKPVKKAVKSKAKAVPKKKSKK